MVNNKKVFALVLVIILFSACNLNFTKNNADVKLYTAMNNCNLESAKEAVFDGADLNATTSSISTAILPRDNNTISFCTVSNNANNIATYLLDNGADANYHQKASLLMSEISLGKYDICKSLIDNGADVNYSFTYGENTVTSLNYLFFNGITENGTKIIDLLFENDFKDINHSLNNMINYNIDRRYNNILLIETLDEVSYIIEKLYTQTEYDSGISDLMYAVSQGNSNEAVRLLSKEKISDNIDSLMLFACAFCDENVIKMLIEKGADINKVLLSDSSGKYNLLDLAVAYNDIETVEFLSECNLNYSSNSVALSMSLINKEHSDIIDYIIAHIDEFKLSQFNDEQPLLYYAVKYDRADFFRKIKGHLNELSSETYIFYLEKAANADFRDILDVFKEQGYSSLFSEILPTVNCDISTYSYLYEYANNPEYVTDIGNIEICGATKISRLDLVEFLLDKGCDINQKDTVCGNTAIFYAIENGDSEIVAYLLKNGADLSIKNDDGETPLIYAIKTHSHNIVKLLIDNGADINQKNSSGEIPLKVAKTCSLCCNDEIMLELLY